MITLFGKPSPPLLFSPITSSNNPTLHFPLSNYKTKIYNNISHPIMETKPILDNPNNPPFAGGRRDEWSEGAVGCLLDAYESKWELRSRAKLKGRDWDDVARRVSGRAAGARSAKTPSQCKNKIESMKKRYRSESAATVAGGGGGGGFSRWPFFGRIQRLMNWKNDSGGVFMLDESPAAAAAVQIGGAPAMNGGVGAGKGYVVLNRPWAFVQWLEKAKIEEDYILMSEPDHIFVNPLPNLSRGDYPAAFPFFYIKPSENEILLRKFYPEDKGPVTNIDPIGNSPVIIKKSQLENIAPTWMNVSLKMKEDPEADKVFGWVLEMYAYAVASALHGVQHILHKNFMIQPPWDLNVGNAFIIHYTYGCDYSLKGELTYGKIGEWRFDKRSHIRGPPPRNISLPPPGVPESVVRLVKMVNEATANIPGWEEGR